MSGIYIHIPFCHTKCHYCNFYSGVSLKYKKEFLNALLNEISLRKDYLNGDKISTVYFGGGTPSVLEVAELEAVLKNIKRNFIIEDNCEFTLEANPEDVSKEWINDIKPLGINRLSIGCQAFDDVLLKNLNRNHKTKDSINALEIALNNGVENLSADLIYGIPGLSTDKWIDSLQALIKLDIPHISAYNLTVEPKTALEVLIRKKKYPELKDDLGKEQFLELIKLLEKHEYEHYEISNFARNKLYSRHNTNYWLNKKYLGLGPSAHSYNLNSRSWNISNIKSYIENINSGNEFFETEELSIKDKFNEYLMLSLRTIWGVNLDYVLKTFGNNYVNTFKKDINEYLQKGYVLKNENTYVLSKKGKLFADKIASDCFV